MESISILPLGNNVGNKTDSQKRKNGGCSRKDGGLQHQRVCVGLSWMFRGPELDGTGFVWRWEDRETVQQVSPVLGQTGPPPPPSSSSSSCRVSCASFSSSSWIYL